MTENTLWFVFCLFKCVEQLNCDSAALDALNRG
eukprot:COSAG01_NODE_54637_length_330_cov_9.852814_1_plen_32_part_10